jgi:hypothetical protein
LHGKELLVLKPCGYKFLQGFVTVCMVMQYGMEISSGIFIHLGTVDKLGLLRDGSYSLPHCGPVKSLVSQTKFGYSACIKGRASTASYCLILANV